MTDCVYCVGPQNGEPECPCRMVHINDIKKRKRGEHPDGSWWHGQPIPSLKEQAEMMDKILWARKHGVHFIEYRYDKDKPVYRVKCGQRKSHGV